MLEKTEGAIKNEQSGNTDNRAHKTQGNVESSFPKLKTMVSDS
jgi:hypothetical protein